MGFREFDGSLDGEEKSRGYVAFDGKLDEEPGFLSKAKTAVTSLLSGDGEPAETMPGAADMINSTWVESNAEVADMERAIPAEAERLRRIQPNASDADIQALAKKRVIEAMDAKPAKRGNDREERVQRYIGESQDRAMPREDAEKNVDFDLRQQGILNSKFTEPSYDPAQDGEKIATGYDPTIEREQTRQENDQRAAEADARNIHEYAKSIPAPIRGLGIGFGQSYALMGGAVGYLGDLIDNPELQKAGIDWYNENMRSSGAMRNAPSFTGIASAADASEWVAENLGYVAYQAAEAFVSFGVGNQIGKQVGKEALVGAIAGFINNERQTIGAIYGDAVENAKATGDPIPSLLQIAVGATTSAAVDTFADKLGIDAAMVKSAKGGIFTRLAKTIPAQMGVQGGTEGVQLVPEEWGAGKDPFRPGMAAQYIDEMAVGALGGAGPGIMQGIRQPDAPSTQPPPFIPPAEVISAPSIDAAIAAADAATQPVEMAQPPAAVAPVAPTVTPAPAPSFPDVADTPAAPAAIDSAELLTDIQDAPNVQSAAIPDAVVPADSLAQGGDQLPGSAPLAPVGSDVLNGGDVQPAGDIAGSGGSDLAAGTADAGTDQALDAYLVQRDGQWKLKAPPPIQLRDAVIAEMDLRNNPGTSAESLPDTEILRQQLAKAEQFSAEEVDTLGKLVTAVAQDAARTIESGEMPVFRVGKLAVAITPSAQNPGKFQVTRYNDSGALGDSQYNSVEDAIRQEGLAEAPRLTQAEAGQVMQNAAQAEAEYQARRAEVDAPSAQPVTAPSQGDAEHSSLQIHPAAGVAQAIAPEANTLAIENLILEAKREIESGNGFSGLASNRLKKILETQSEERAPYIKALWPDYVNPREFPKDNPYAQEMWLEVNRGDIGARVPTVDLSSRLRQYAVDKTEQAQPLPESGSNRPVIQPEAQPVAPKADRVKMVQDANAAIDSIQKSAGHIGFIPATPESPVVQELVARKDGKIGIADTGKAFDGETGNRFTRSLVSDTPENRARLVEELGAKVGAADTAIAETEGQAANPLWLQAERGEADFVLNDYPVDAEILNLRRILETGARLGLTHDVASMQSDTLRKSGRFNEVYRQPRPPSTGESPAAQPGGTTSLSEIKPAKGGKLDISGFTAAEVKAVAKDAGFAVDVRTGSNGRLLVTAMAGKRGVAAPFTKSQEKAIREGLTGKDVKTLKPKTYDTGTLLGAIRAMGGISLSEMQDITGETNRRGDLFREGGQSIDEIARALANDYGFGIDLNSPNDNGGVNQAAELIREALDGTEVLSMERQEQAAHKADVMDRAERLGIKTKFRKFSTIEQDVIKLEEQKQKAAEAKLDEVESAAYDEVLERAYKVLGDDRVQDALEELAGKYEALSARDYQRAAREYFEGLIHAELQQAAEGPAGASSQTGGEPAGVGGIEAPGFSLETQSEDELRTREEQVAAAKEAEEAEAREADAKARKEQADKDKADIQNRLAKQPFEFGVGSKEAKTVQRDLLSSPQQTPAERFEIGRSLTKEQKKAVLRTLVDVYKVNDAPREFKGLDQNGNERYGYAYSPEFFVKSDITGAMVRYYVTLPDSRIAHPTELFPEYSQSDIDAELERQRTEERNKKADDEFRLKTLNSRKSSDLNEANRIFWKQNPGLAAQSLEYHPALLTNGTEFVRTDPAYVERDLKLLGDGWREKKFGEGDNANTPADAGVSVSKSVAEMSPADLLRAAADKMDAEKVASQSEFSSLEKELAAKTHDTESDGDVGVVVGGGKVKYVSLNDAVDVARKAISAGTKAVPFQISNATGIRIGDVDRVLAVVDKVGAENKEGDWLGVLFDQFPDALPETPKPAFSDSAIAAVRKQIDATISTLEASRAEWVAKVYKRNKTQVELQGDGPSNRASLSIGSINEKKRERAIAQIDGDIRGLKKFAQQLDADPVKAIESVGKAVTESESQGFIDHWSGLRDSKGNQVTLSADERAQMNIANEILGDKYYGRTPAAVAILSAYREATAKVGSGETADTTLTVKYGGGELDIDLGKPAYQATMDEVEAAVRAKGFSADVNPRTKYDPMQMWRNAHATAVAIAAKDGKAIPARVLYDYRGLIRNDLNDEQSDMAADKMVEVFRDTNDYEQAVQAYRDFGKQSAAQQQAEGNDHDHFTLERLNRDANEMESVTFARGEYVRYRTTENGEDLFGEIDGISHARREFSVDGLWYPFGFAYKAERPEAAKPKNTVPVSKVIDAINKKHGEGLTEADRVPKTGPYTLAEHADLMDRLEKGEVSLDEYKSAFGRLRASKDALTAELSAMKKDDIMSVGRLSAHYKSDTKDRLVKSAANNLADAFHLGESMSFVMGQRDATVINYVNDATADTLAEYAARRKARVAEYMARRTEMLEGIKNPQTISDFQSFISYHKRDGKTNEEARMMLTPEQRVRFDSLLAEESRAARKGRAEQAEVVRAPGEAVGASEIIKTRHTKHGHDLWQFTLDRRVAPDEFRSLVAQAKRMGGDYSSYRGNGAIPGWQFRTEEAAIAFRQLVAGDATAAQAVVAERRDAYADDRSQTAVERLNEMADKLEDAADDKLNADRKTNTDKRARQAASAESAANTDKALAKTMRNIAEAISNGSAKFLDRVRQKVQVEMLREFLNRAKDNEIRAKYPTYREQENHKGEKPTDETADYANYPRYTAFRSDLAKLGRQLLENDGTKKLGASLLKVADDVTDAYLDFAKKNLHKVSTFKTANGDAIYASRDDAETAIKRSGFKGKAIVLPFKRGQNIIIQSPSFAKENGIWKGDDDRRITLTPDFGAELVEAAKKFASQRFDIPWVFNNTYDSRKRLSGMGIETAAEFRTALREFATLSEAVAAPDKIKEMERKMIGRRNDGLDFFPTPQSVADEMIEAADIKEGMSVLEPSAGMGHIAERIRAAGVDPDVIELSGDRRELLEAKGFAVVGNDFMEMTPRGFTYGDVFRAPDGALGVMRGSGGLGSGRVGLDLLDENGQPDTRRGGWYDREDLVGVEKRASNSGYDRIIMNPPFGDRRDAEHVQHAYSLLKPGGRVVAIMGEGVFFGQDKKAQAFREWLDEVGGTSEKLEDGTFLDPSLPVNTGVNARMVVIDKETDKGVALFSKSQQPIANPITEEAFLAKAAESVGSRLIPALMKQGKVKFITAEEANAITGNKLYHMAWHGSPHDHDGFDSSKIGTGEGAQAYGWGHYFAGAREVAEGYRIALTSDAAKKQFDVAAALAAAKWFKSGMVVDGTTYYSRMDLQDDIAKQNLSSMHMPDDVRKVFADKLSEPNGRLYQVELAPEPDEYLDWDKPLSEQSEKVKAALDGGDAVSRGARNKWVDGAWGETPGRPPGGVLYQTLSDKLGGQQAASEYLRSLGIRGIKYLDGMSRNQIKWWTVQSFSADGKLANSKRFTSIDGTDGAETYAFGQRAEGYKTVISEPTKDESNYVIFDDADIKIEAKYSKDGRPLAFYLDGVTYFIPESIPATLTKEEAFGLLKHEIGVHAMNLGRDSAEFAQILKSLESHRKIKNKQVVAAYQRAKDANSSAENMNEEALGYLVESAPQSSIAQRFIAWFKTQINKVLGAARLHWAYTPADMVAMAQSALMRAPGRIGQKVGGSGTAMPSMDGNVSTLAKVFRSLSEFEESAKYPKSNKTDMKELAADLSTQLEVGDPEVTKLRYIDDDGSVAYRESSRRWNVKASDGSPVYVTENIPEGTIYINVSELKEGESEGSLIYQLVGQYAYNNGLKFIGDPYGITNGAIYRRTENMISLAIKLGTTDFMEPHPDQLKAEDNSRQGEEFFWPGFEWNEGDFSGNLHNMLMASYTAVKHHVPEIENVTYDARHAQFIDTRTGQRVAKGYFRSLASDPAGARKSHAGRNTLKRSALAHSVVSGKVSWSEWRSALDELDVGEVGSRLKGTPLEEIRYSKAPQTPAQAGVSVSGRQQSIPSTTQPPAPPSRQTPLGLSGGQPGNNASWNGYEPTKLDDVIRTLQDRHIDSKRTIQAIKAAGRAVADKWDVYLQETLFHGRAAKRTLEFTETELNPLVAEMAMRGLSIADVDEYLHASHAEEANALIADRNPSLPDGGSGMTNQEAQDYLSSLSPLQQKKLEAIARRVDAIIAKTRETYVAYGLESRETVDGWADTFAHYVPLMREDKDGGMGIGQGFSIKGKEAKSRTGSTRKVVDILANIAMQRERAIVRGEKNRVAVALMGLAKLNPNPDFWTFDKVPMISTLNEETGLVEQHPDPLFKSRDNVIVAKIADGKGGVQERAVIFNEENEQAMNMVSALKNLDAAQLEGLLGATAKITRYFASINTQYNPVFGVTNLVRDFQDAMLNLSSTPIAGHKVEVAKHTLGALRGIYIDTRQMRKGHPATSAYAQLWEEFQHEGGQTGYRDMFRTSADRAKAIEKMLDPHKWTESPLGKVFTAGGLLKVPLTKAQDIAGPIFDWLSDYNEAMENAVRLSSYKVGLEQGMTKQQAAAMAKGLTVNFNRKGQVGLQAGALYAFFNASMQGTGRIAQTILTIEGNDIKTIRLSKAGKMIVSGGILLGSLQAMMLMAMGFGDDEPPEFVRERNTIIPIGDKKYITIPMPLGFAILPNIGRISTEFVMGGFKAPGKHVTRLMGIIADAFNPIGGNGTIAQIISPTAVDPIVSLAENKDWTGKPIAKASYDKTKPGYKNWKDTASTPGKLIAEAINTMSGGTKHVAGAVSPTPDQIDYLFGQVTGGVGREASKLEQSAMAIYSGENLPPHKIPLVGRFYGNADDQSSQGTTFYNNINRINEYEAQVKGLRKEGKGAEATQFIRENPEAKLIFRANYSEKAVRNLRKKKHDMIEKGAPREEIKAMEDRIAKAMRHFNEAVKASKQRQKEAA